MLKIKKQIFLQLRFPDLALEANGLDYHKKSVCITENNIIYCSSSMAIKKGIIPNMRVSTARALCPTLLTKERQECQENELLNKLAQWAYSFSSQVSIRSKGLCIEITGSYRLFGNLLDIKSNIHNYFMKKKYRVSSAFGHTPEMADIFLLLGICPEPHNFKTALKKAPIEALGLKYNDEENLIRMGFKNLGDVLQVSQRELNRRILLESSELIGRISGQKKIIPNWYKPLNIFKQSISFFQEIETCSELFFPINHLIDDLCEWLNRRQESTEKIKWMLSLSDRKVREIEISLKTPKHTKEGLLSPTLLTLETISLENSINKIELIITKTCKRVDDSADLFNKKKHNNRSQLLDRINAKLGKDSIKRMVRIEDYRPNIANQIQSERELPKCVKIPKKISKRPIWILENPKYLCKDVIFPENMIPLQGPEKIESGWWDENPITRIYWIAETDKNIAWIYQDQKDKSWWLSGWFT